MRSYTIIFLLFATLNLRCSKKNIPDEGFIKVKGGKVWYKIFGSDKKKAPLLLLHGGPGFPSYYLTPLETLATDRPIIFYDQLGCGRSDKPGDTALWKLSRFVEELVTIRTELRLDSIHLFAHSWGTILAAEFLSTQPKGIKSIIFAGPIFSTNQYLQNVNELKLALPTNIRDTLLLHEKNGTIFSESYQNAYNEFSKRHWCRKYPYPKEIEESINHTSTPVFNTMWGHYEFYCTGNLKDFERRSVLKEIKMPTLFTCGRYDLNTPEEFKRYAEQVEGSEFVVLENSAHMTMNEEPDAYVKVLRQYLAKHE
jgi:proline iminopeptidase